MNLNIYLDHLRNKENINSLLVHFTGVYTYDKHHIIVMKNIFPERMNTSTDPVIIVRRYDLKGSIVNRDVGNCLLLFKKNENNFFFFLI